MENIKDKLIQVSKLYADQTLVRAAINAIPFVGGSIDILLSSTGQNFVIKRLENFISELNTQLSLLEDSKINHDFLNSEQGFDLMIKAFNSASRTRQKEKLLLYSKIIKGALTEGKQFDEDDPELYLKIIEELSVKEILIAKYLYDIKSVEEQEYQAEDKKKDLSNDAWRLSKKYPELDSDELTSILIRLEKTGLIKEVVGSFIGYGGGCYMINSLFKKFMTFIERIE